MTQERWLTVAEIVERLQVHEQTVRRWLRAGRLPGRNLGGRAGYRVRERDLDVFLSGQIDQVDAAGTEEREGKAAA